MNNIELELKNIRSYRDILLFKFGLIRAFSAYLATLGHMVLIYQVVTLSWGVITNTKGVIDALFWMGLFLFAVIYTPKALKMSTPASLFFLKLYTILINSIFACFFILTLYSLIVSSGYVQGDVDIRKAEDIYEVLDLGIDFHYTNAILFLYSSFWFFAMYINKDVPEGFMNYASAPIFIIATVAIIVAAFNSDAISLYHFFSHSNTDAFFRIIFSVYSIGLLIAILKKVVFHKGIEKLVSENSKADA
ncbi:hypothetical protein [Vibrio rotiferianus]|uniref:hypothetical protein n=1 Tax=Vibrio rotiferianus TaxID=190895 RepID=UPI00390B2296